jgi:hypothetical protein
LSSFNPSFRNATRTAAKASIVIQGLSGSGKSGLALMIAETLAGGWEGVFATDTESKSLDLFEGIRSHLGVTIPAFKKFDLLAIHGFKPSNYWACKEAARQAGAKALITDSITQMWTGRGGVLQLVGEKERSNSKLNKYNAWGDPEVALEKDTIFELIRDSDMHMISTVRVKEKFDIIQGAGLKSLGEQQLQMPDLKYEPDLVLDMVEAGSSEGRPPKARIIKSRYTIFTKDEVYTFDKNTLDQLRDYLASGVDPAELIEQQRLEFIREIKYILDSSPSKQTVWTIIKSEAGHAETPIDELPIIVLRGLLSRLLN